MRSTMNSRSNVGGVIAASTVPKPEVLVVDIDGNDWSVLRACLGVCEPRLVVIEYNAAVGPHTSWAMPYDDDNIWDGDRWHGVSYSLLKKRAHRLGYQLVACDPLGVNAFLVRSDLVGTLGTFDSATLCSPPLYGAPFGHPWRSRRRSDVALASEDFTRIRVSGRDVHRVGDRIVVILDVHNESESWLSSLASFRSSSRR